MRIASGKKLGEGILFALGSLMRFRLEWLAVG